MADALAPGEISVMESPYRYSSYVEDIMGPLCFDYGFGPFRWVCCSGDPADLKKTDAIAAKVLEEMLAEAPEDIRGAGNLLGAEQSGFIVDIGYETYQKILEEAIIELKETDFKDVFAEELEKTPRQYVRDVTIETDVEMLMPEKYVT